MRVLLVEDNRSLAGNIYDFLELQGHQVDFVDTGNRCLALLAEDSFDVIILDVMMPGIDGYETCRQLRRKLFCQTPVIFLTAKSELEHKLEGFDAGGDDYLTKPFELDELLCRLTALTARGKRKDIGQIQYRDLLLDTRTGEVRREGQKLEVNNIQFRILQCLYSQAPQVVTRTDLEYEIWGDECPDSDVLRTHIYQLRRVIDPPSGEGYIDTVRGKGFRLKP